MSDGNVTFKQRLPFSFSSLSNLNKSLTFQRNIKLLVALVCVLSCVNCNDYDGDGDLGGDFSC